MKLNLLALSLVALPLLTAQASNTVVSNFTTTAAAKPGSHPLMLSTANGGALFPNNAGIVAAGFFSMTDAQISAVATAPAGAARTAAWAAVAASFVQFGTPGVVGGAPGLNNPGLYRLTTGAPNLAGGPFDGKNIYTVVGNGATLLNSTDIVVFKSNNQFALDPTPEGTGNYLGTPPTGTLLLGTPGTPGAFYPAGVLAGITTTPTNALAVGVIPEPATALLGVLSLGFGFIRRRRR